LVSWKEDGFGLEFEIPEVPQLLKSPGSFVTSEPEFSFIKWD
jgi:hypothetical protein